MSQRKISAEQEKQLREQYKYQLSSVAGELPPLTAMSFMGLQDMMEKRDVDQYTQLGKQIATRYALGALGGLLASLALTSLNPANFLKRPLYVRLPARLLLGAVPLGVGVWLALPLNERVFELERKYNSRFQKFRATRDFNHIDPQGVLFQEYMEKVSR